MDTLFFYILTAIMSIGGLFYYLYVDALIGGSMIVSCIAINFIVVLAYRREQE